MARRPILNGRRRSLRRLCHFILALAGTGLLLTPSTLFAQVVPSGQNAPVQLPPTAALPEKPPQIPPPEQLVALVRNVLLSVNDANLTGNYSVLRDLTAPESQKFNTAENLASSFGPIRQQKTDIAIVAVATPEFKQLPAITPKGLLRVNGELVTDPRVTFDLFFQSVEGRWRPYAIGIGVVPVPLETPKPMPQPQQVSKPAPPKKPPSQSQQKPPAPKPPPRKPIPPPAESPQSEE